MVLRILMISSAVTCPKLENAGLNLLGMEGGGDIEVASQIVSIFLSKNDMKPSADSRFVGARALGARRELS